MLSMTSPHEQSIQPGVDRFRSAQPTDVSPGLDERFLGSVFGSVTIAKDQEGDRIQPADRLRDERIEGVMIALPRADRDVSLHRSPSSARSGAALTV